MNLQDQLEEYAKQKQISMILNKMESYTTLESFNSMRIGFEKDFEQITGKFRRIPVTSELTNAINNTRDYIDRL